MRADVIARAALALLVLAQAANLAACRAPPAAAAVKPQARAVTVVPVELREMVGAVAASGDLVPLQEAAVSPEVAGYRVAAVLADVGQYVRKGQVLARLEPALVKAQLAQQQALVVQAETQAVQAEDQALRVADLDGAGVLSEEQIRQRRFQAKAARATAQAQAAALREMRTREALLAVTAPVPGLVLEKTVRPGDMAAAGGEAWFRLAKDGVVELQAQMSEDDLARIRPGSPARVTLPSGATATGRVRLVGAEIDAKTKLGYVRVTLPVRADIRAGGFARAVFDGASGRAPSVPETAVRYDADGASVMVVQPDNRVRRVSVRSGARGGGRVQLLDGPVAGTMVIENAASFLLDGDKVRLVEGVR